MKLNLMKGLIATTAAALLAPGCALLEPREERYVAPPLGTTWVTSRRDTGSYGSGTTQLPGRRGERMWKGQQMVTFESPDGVILSHPEGGWTDILNKDTPVISWDPPANWQWPLEVGKSWKSSYRLTIHAAKRTVPFTNMQRVEAYEDVTVPAGTFKAYRISTVDTLGNENVQWLSPQHGIFVKQILKRTPTHAQGAGTREVELVSYTRGK